MNNPSTVKCPYCGKPSLFTPENIFRPFCSERCKLIDLGQWAEEKYQVPLQSLTEEDFEEIASADLSDQDVSSADTESLKSSSDSENPDIH